MKKKTYDIGIIGGGASGCTAALSAGDASVAILEKNDSLLKKVIASGNGRCNISNASCDTVDEVLSFFKEIGVYTVCEEEGRLYPRTRYSRTVTERIEAELDRRNIEVFTGCEVKEIQEADGGFIVLSDDMGFFFKKILIASGGKAGPQFGTTGDSYRFLRRLGHTVETLRPALTAMECEGDFSKLKGIRAEGRVELLKDGSPACPAEHGEIQFTRDGISGICIMNLSRHIVLDKDIPMQEAFKRYRVRIDFAPDLEMDELEAMVKGAEGISSFVRKELAEVISEGVNSACEAAERLKGYEITITGTKGWKDAQVTSGGVSSDEIDMDTMESKLVHGLYVSGEALDYDGPCGGFNLNNAWITGIRAGKAMAACIG